MTSVALPAACPPMRLDSCRADGAASPPADVKVLRRVAVVEGWTGEGDPSSERTAAIVDVETTGLAPDSDRIVELAIRRVAFDADGIVTRVGRSYEWLEDPGQPLDAKITALTGLTDSAVQGRSIDDPLALSVLGSATVIVAHNAGFDRRFIDRRFPLLSGHAWACSCREIDWSARGMDGRSLGWLCAQAGYFFDGHRGGHDVDALITLLRARSLGDVTPLAELMETAAKPGWRVRAIGANIATKECLKERGYSWNAGDRIWEREIKDADRLEEESWLSKTIYCPDAFPKAFEPRFEPVDWTTRHS